VAFDEAVTHRKETGCHPSEPGWAYRADVRRRIARRLGRDGYSAVEDTQQEVALKLRRVDWEDKDDPEAYAYRVVDNAAIDERRRQQRAGRQRAISDLALLPDPTSAEDDAVGGEALAMLLAVVGGPTWAAHMTIAKSCGATIPYPDLVSEIVKRFIPLLLLDLTPLVDSLRKHPEELGPVRVEVEQTLSAAVDAVVPLGHALSRAERHTPDFDRNENRARQRQRRQLWTPVVQLGRLVLDEGLGPGWPAGRATAWWVAFVGTVPVAADRPRTAQPWLHACSLQLARLGLPVPLPRNPRGRGIA
jgi:hypothetical protein